MRLNYKFFKTGITLALVANTIVSCNKSLPRAEPIVTPAPTGSSIAELLNDPNFSILKAAVTRSTSMTALLSDKTAVYTFFAPTDAAFQASGIPSAAAIATFRPGQLDTLLKYHLVGGQALSSAAIPTTFPNLQLPSSFVLAPPSAALPPGLRMSIFPSKRGTSLWVNNIPITQTDIPAANGIVHKVAALVAPPTTTIKGILASDPANFSIMSAAIARADSGQTGLNKLDSVLNYAPANLTLFAPNNTAFRTLFPPGTPDPVIIALLNNPAFFTAQTVRGLVAYHLLGTRAFSVNFSATPSLYNTQLVIPGTPPTVVPVLVTYTGATFTVKGFANPTESNVVTRDKNAVNGVVHVIDQPLKPQ